MRFAYRIGISLFFLGQITCNRELEGPLTPCPEGQTCTQDPTDPKADPKTQIPDKFVQAGATGKPFDPKSEGSGGVKLDDKGNIVLDPGNVSTGKTPIIWVANSGDGTVSKVDARNLKELGRYLTYPGGGADPSRSTVSLSGDAVIANRARPDGTKASAVKIAGDKSGCIDRNKNGKIDTFEGTGAIPAEYRWAAGQTQSPDECVLWLTNLSQAGVATLPRAAGFDATIAGDVMARPKVYIGLYGSSELIRLDAETGAIDKRIPLGLRPYGLVLDKSGFVWVLDTSGPLAKVDVRNQDVVTRFTGTKAAPCAYGIAADAKGFIYTAGGSCLSRFNPQTETWERLTVPGASSLRGVALDQNSQAWVAETSKGLMHIDASLPMMTYKGFAQVAGSNVGAAVDFDGKPWVISQGQSKAFRVDPATYMTQAVTVGSGPYTYSDMTGFQLRNAGAAIGTYRQIFQGCGTDTRWLNLNFKALAPAGTQIVVRIRSAADGVALRNAPWMDVATIPPEPTLPLSFPARKDPLLEVEFVMRTADAQMTPILSSVSAGYRCEVVLN